MIEGFSKLTRTQKLDVVLEHYLGGSENYRELIEGFNHKDSDAQELFEQFSENTIANFHIPYGVVPNVMIDHKTYCVPMVTEESSVVAAAAKASKFWSTHGGIQTKTSEMEKIGQVHFTWQGSKEDLFAHFAAVKEELLNDVAPMLVGMKQRGGGLLTLDLLDKSDLEPDYFQLFATFNTCDAMGANLINSVLEFLARSFEKSIKKVSGKYQTVMSILSNYTPNCLVKARVSCPVKVLGSDFCNKFVLAVRIAEIDVHRATTHNKGIMNGIDGVVLATGNDFRAVEACAHTYAARKGHYRSLSSCTVINDIFHFALEVPMALGTVGGLTSLHPMAKISLDLLNRPPARQLMRIAAAIGLMQNFSALSSLVTSGIQKGHMKMHLMNILNHLGADEEERRLCREYFSQEKISFSAVKEFLSSIRKYQ